MPDVLTLREAAAWLRLSERALYALARGHRVPATQLGGKWLFPRTVLERWLAAQPHIQTLYVSYNALLADPQPEIARVNDFLGGGLDTAVMRSVIDVALYRQRA